MADERTEPAANRGATGQPQAAQASGGGQAAAAGPTIRWDDSNLKSSYANVCNVSSTREEVVLVFGINHAWERGAREVQVQLTDRVILSPFAAKRLSLLLAGVLKEYESRFGALNLDARRPGEGSPA